MKNLYTRTVLLPLLVLCAAHAAAGRQAGPKLDWREFTSAAGGFSVKLPGEPRVTTPQMVKGPLTFKRNLHEVSAGGYSFAVEYVDMPAGYSEPELALEGGISGITRSFVADGGRVLTNGKVARGTCEGREATVAVRSPSGGTGFAQARAFYSGQRYFFLLFMAPGDGPAEREAGRLFMDSLVIKDGCRAALAPTAAPTAEPVRSTVEGVPDAATGWRRIESAAHGFGVLMPGPARLESKQERVQPFPLFHHEYVHEGEENIYSAEVMGDYPEGFYSKDSSYESLLDMTFYNIKRNVDPLGLTFGGPRRLSAGGYPGREYTMANEREGLGGRLQVYATPRRAYVFIALGRGKGFEADFERFFSSVRVSPK